MSQTYILLVLLFLPLAIFSQDTLNQTDPAGRKQGFWKKSDSAGHPVYEGRFKDGKPVGTFRYFYPDGQVKTRSTFSENGKFARVVSYFQNGNKMASGNYLNEKRDSIWQFFSEKDEILVSEESYQTGVKEGVSRVYFPGGGVAEITTWKNGVMDGLSEQYFSDGKIKVRLSYKNGEKNDSFTTWFLSGQPMISGQYNHGHPSGQWIYYNEDGSVLRTEDH